MTSFVTDGGSTTDKRTPPSHYRSWNRLQKGLDHTRERAGFKKGWPDGRTVGRMIFCLIWSQRDFCCVWIVYPLQSSLLLHFCEECRLRDSFDLDLTLPAMFSEMLTVWAEVLVQHFWRPRCVLMFLWLSSVFFLEHSYLFVFKSLSLTFEPWTLRETVLRNLHFFHLLRLWWPPGWVLVVFLQLGLPWCRDRVVDLWS